MNPNPPTLLARRAHHVSPLWHLPPPYSGFHTAGYIGGRMVKWLEEIEVASEESDNYYHRKVRVCRKGGVCRFVPRLAKCTLGVGPRGSNLSRVCEVSILLPVNQARTCRLQSGMG